MPDHGEVVADEEIGKAELVLQVAHQIEDLRLDRHIERRGRLVPDDEFGFRRQRARNRDTLSLAAGKFVRVLPTIVGVETDQAEQLADAGANIGLVSAQVAGCDRLWWT